MKKNILITGSTDGIGRLLAFKLAEEGHQIYIHGRSQEKLELLSSEIKERTKNEHVSVFLTDFSDLKAVQ